MCCGARLIGVSHLEVGIGESRLAAWSEITLNRIRLALCLRLTLRLILHVGAVNLLWSIALRLLWRSILREDVGNLSLATASGTTAASKEVASWAKLRMLLRHKENATTRIRGSSKMSTRHAHKRR